MVAIDPGVRTFLACYASDNEGFGLGSELKEAAMKILQSISAVDSALSKCKGDAKQTRTLRRKKLRLYQKYKDVRDDYHFKMCRMLSRSYGAVLLPHFETKRLAASLRPKTNREMFAMSHWLFAKRLEERCVEDHTVFLQPGERHTTKTCGRCGQINHAIGSSEVFWCNGCKNRCHRDLHAARNILLACTFPCELSPPVLEGMGAFSGLMAVCTDDLHAHAG